MNEATTCDPRIRQASIYCVCLERLGGGIVLVESTPLGLPAFLMELVWFYSLTAFRVATTISFVAGLMPALKPQVWPRLQSYVRNK
jgi:hypothetical protein